MNTAPFSGAVRDAAIAWIVRMQSGHVTAQDRIALQAWRAAEPAHELAWQRVSRLPLLQQPGADVLRDPDARRALELAGPEPVQRRHLLRCALLMGVAGAVGWRASSTVPVQAAFATYRTGVGERREWQLPDGSRLWLNTATAVDLGFIAQQRGLRLIDGELSLAAPIEARPIVLTTANAELNSMGAQLCVRCDGSATRVTVLKGDVQLKALRSGETLSLRAGWNVTVSGHEITAPAPAHPYSVTAWERGILPIKRLPLSTLLQELGRYRRGILRCDASVAGLQVTGSFPLDDTDAALAMLPRALPVRVERITRYWVTVLPA